MVRITGNIVDATGSPVANALVSIGTFWTNSDSRGSFYLDIPVGQYPLKVVHRDYPEKTRQISVNAPTTLNITLGR
ncbi:MAG: carboxypeptidase-like regulatory domain-containing protein [Dehalococcoidales bacterium]|nr:carboxypeptidase-like regulatory domain-containing protein [Candidatus Thermoplasmatota archaeon]MDD5511348.1 carboxypeptidase-like regulatory domain-containing protein [Dehalococcoidales bacterium]